MGDFNKCAPRLSVISWVFSLAAPRSPHLRLSRSAILALFHGRGADASVSKKAGGSFLESRGVHNARSQALKRNVVPISQCMREIVRGKCGTLRGQRVYAKGIAPAKK